MLGEEFGVTGGGSRRWIVDPIDGTRNYSRGIPVWATLIALEEDGEIRLGVVSAPALHRRWHAERGGGAWVNDDRIRVSAVRQIEDAVLSFALEQPIPALAGYAWHARGYGDFWAHMLVAEGAVDGAVDAVGVKIWDLAAIQPIVEEAGGRFTDAAGEARVDGGTAISSNGHLHDAAARGGAVDGVRTSLTPFAAQRQLTESRKATPSPPIAADSSIGRIGVAVKCSHGVHGAVIRASVAALSTSMIATPAACRRRSRRSPGSPLPRAAATARTPSASAARPPPTCR